MNRLESVVAISLCPQRLAIVERETELRKNLGSTRVVAPVPSRVTGRRRAINHVAEGRETAKEKEEEVVERGRSIQTPVFFLLSRGRDESKAGLIRIKNERLVARCTRAAHSREPWGEEDDQNQWQMVRELCEQGRRTMALVSPSRCCCYCLLVVASFNSWRLRES